jgi:UDP-2,3-diacylglucosamine hydrolase
LAAEQIRLAVKKTLIVSDVHLKVSALDQGEQAAFVDFLRGISADEYDRVICLGDLFDFWFEYRHAIFSDYFEVLRALAEMRDAGMELHLICGNHDFWAGRFLGETLGMHIHSESVTLPFGEEEVHFIHGDGINPADWKYHLYKQFARNRFVIGAFRLIHPDWAMAIARGVSHSSRTLKHVEDRGAGPEATSIAAYAAAVLGRGEADVVVCGHSHCQVSAEYATPTGTGLYINAGDWLENRAYVVWSAGEFTLFSEDLTG